MQEKTSSIAYLCKDEQLFQQEGVEGTLSFDGSSISFASTDGSQNLNIPVNELMLADLNNIMGQAQVVFTGAAGQKYVFIFAKPITVGQAYKKGIFKSGGVFSYWRAKELGTTVLTAKTWRDALISGLPAEKVRFRKEVHPLRTVALGIAIPLAILVFAFALLKVLL